MQEIEINVMRILDKIEHGFKNEKEINMIGNEIACENDFGKFYFLLSPEELLEKKCGVCWDQVELERKLFKKKE